MKIAEINMLTNGSTGKIMFSIAETARASGHTVKTYAPIPFIKGQKNKTQSIPDHFWWGTRTEAMFHYYAGTLLGANGLFSYFGTKALIRDLEKFSPDIVHLHNLHGFCLNMPLFFKYLKKSAVQVVWTFHDCWPFTGHCPYFTVSGCEKWQTRCCSCPQPKIYPKMYLDTSKSMHKRKKQWFASLDNLTIVTPSEWLADLTKKSFFCNHPVMVINNGIDLSIFNPRKSDFKEKYNIGNKAMILGVAFDWGYRKGLDVFIDLAKRLDKKSYQIVLVGTNDRIDEQIPDNIISIHRTNNQTELAEIYSAADVFVNPTREDNYPTVNMESIACGTPILTFRTGGSPEIPNSVTGSVVDCNDIDGMEHEIIRITEEAAFTQKNCIQRAESFDGVKCFAKYVELFNLICKGD